MILTTSDIEYTDKTQPCLFELLGDIQCFVTNKIAANILKEIHYYEQQSFIHSLRLNICQT